MTLNSKQKYRELCKKEHSIHLFSRDWWLDITAGADSWDVALVESGGEVVAAMPYVKKTVYGFQYLTQPALTQKLGPWIKYSNTKLTKRLEKEKDLMGHLIDQLPKFSFFQQAWDYHYKNWLPFYWKGFKQTTSYTYVIPDLSDLDQVWSDFRENIRGDCRKAEKRFGIRIRTDLGIEDFLKLNRKTFERQGRMPPDSDEFIKRIDKVCGDYSAKQIFIAEDEKGMHHAGVYIIWDENSAYYLMGGGDPDLRSSGATALCIWHAIKFAATVTKKFDFEGSMIEPIERFFRAFGAQQMDYYYIYKVPSIFFRLGISLRLIIKPIYVKFCTEIIKINRVYKLIKKLNFS